MGSSSTVELSGAVIFIAFDREHFDVLSISTIVVVEEDAKCVKLEAGDLFVGIEGVAGCDSPEEYGKGGGAPLYR